MIPDTAQSLSVNVSSQSCNDPKEQNRYISTIIVLGVILKNSSKFMPNNPGVNIHLQDLKHLQELKQ